MPIYLKPLFISFFFISVVAQAKTKVDFSADKIHSLLVFVETVSGEPNRPPHLKKIFDESRFNNSESQKQIEKFRALDSSLRKFIEFDGFPPERHAGVGVKSLITTQSAFSKSLVDFRQRILGLMPYEDINQLIATLEYFEPIYTELIWKPNQRSLETTVEKFKLSAQKWKLDDLFQSALKFYSSSWPKDQPFQVSLYPIPKEAELSNAQSHGAFESVGIIMGGSVEGKFGVVFHELCHSLYEAQSADFQKNLSQWFNSHPSEYSSIALNWFNEALATAIGNGWAYQKAKGKIDKTEWYHQEVINGFAQALYPKVLEYLNHDRSMDQNFVNFAVETFQAKFPQAIYEFESLMNSMVVLADGKGQVKEISKSLRKHFKIQSINGGSPIDDSTSIQQINDSANGTLFLVVRHSERKQLDGLRSLYPQSLAVVSKAPRSGNRIGIFNSDKKRLIVLLHEGSDELSQAIDWMGKKRKLDRLNQLVSIEQ